MSGTSIFSAPSVFRPHTLTHQHSPVKAETSKHHMHIEHKRPSSGLHGEQAEILQCMCVSEILSGGLETIPRPRKVIGSTIEKGKPPPALQPSLCPSRNQPRFSTSPIPNDWPPFKVPQTPGHVASGHLRHNGRLLQEYLRLVIALVLVRRGRRMLVRWNRPCRPNVIPKGCGKHS